MGLAGVMKDIKKKFSKDNPDILFDPTKKYEVIPTGCFAFDFVTGIGGLPRGRITEIIAMESTGKSSLIYATMGRLQRNGGVSVLFDFEQSFDAVYARNVFGVEVDMDSVVVIQPTCVEEGAEIFDNLVRDGAKIDLMCFDSIESMKPRGIIECSLEENGRIGAHATAIGRFTHKLKTAAFKNNFVAVYANQLRNQIAPNSYTKMKGVATGYDPKGQYTTPGGMAPRFLCSIRMVLDYVSKEEGEDSEGLMTKELGLEKGTKLVNIINIKNKCSRPEVKFITHFDHHTGSVKGGWNSAKDIMRLLKKVNRIKQSGTKFVYKGLNETFENLGPKVESEAMFAGNPKLLKDAEDLINSLRDTAEADALYERAENDGVLASLKKGQEEDISKITVVPMD